MDFFHDGPLHQSYLNVLMTRQKIMTTLKPTDIIYLDYNKAFDKVSHKLLLGKLKHYGVQKHILSLKADSLYKRHYQMRVNGEMSRHLVNSGVIQGSVIGSLIFTTYFFDLVDIIEIKMINFAGPCLQLEQLKRDLLEKVTESKCTLLRIEPNKPNET